LPSEDARPDRFAERAEALVLQAGLFTRWATRAGTELARTLPGAAAVQAELGGLERTVLGELRRRLDDIDPLADGRAAADPVATPGRAVPPTQTTPLRVAMAELLVRSVEQTTQRAREYLHLALLRQLLPDEARILAALADGSVYPLVHVDCRTGVTATRRLLSNASSVGRAAGVAVPASVPRYLTRLRHLDLVEVGEHDPALSVQYDIVLTDDGVRAAEDVARAQGRARMVRQTIRISALGRELWDACHPRETGEDVWADAVARQDPPVPDPSPVPDPGTPAPEPRPVPPAPAGAPAAEIAPEPPLTVVRAGTAPSPSVDPPS
jgi:hypothetical protein